MVLPFVGIVKTQIQM